MPFLVDGDNLLGTWPGRRRDDVERRALAQEVARALVGRRVVLVFDGSSPAGTAFGADVHFAGAGRTADDVILAFVRRQAVPRDWIVVTSDRPLGDRCRHAGARVERSDLFRARLRRADRAEKPERVEDVDYWLAEFGEGPSRDAPPSPRRRPRGRRPDGER